MWVSEVFNNKIDVSNDIDMDTLEVYTFLACYEALSGLEQEFLTIFK